MSRSRTRAKTPFHLRYCGTTTPDAQLLTLAHTFVERLLDPANNLSGKHPAIVRGPGTGAAASHARAGSGELWIKLFSEYSGDQCIVYPFSTASSPRGELTFNYKRMPAHRAMCLKVNKLPPEDLPMALHSCGNGHLGCVTPGHLYWGDASKNAEDAARHRLEGKPVCSRANPIKVAAAK